MALFTSMGQAAPVCETSVRLETSYRSRTSFGSARRRTKCVGTITLEAGRWVAAPLVLTEKSLAAPADLPTGKVIDVERLDPVRGDPIPLLP